MEMNEGTQGTLTFVRKGRAVPAEVVWSRRVYTMVRELSTGRTMRVPTDTLKGETDYGYVSFETSK